MRFPNGFALIAYPCCLSPSHLHAETVTVKYLWNMEAFHSDATGFSFSRLNVHVFRLRLFKRSAFREASHFYQQFARNSAKLSGHLELQA